jgi:hypothetical protein
VLIAAAAGIGVILVAVMFAIYRYGDRVIPDGGLVPVHAGPGGWDHWRPKKRGLLAWPVIGAGVSALLVGAETIVELAGNAHGRHGGTAAAGITMIAWVVVIIILPLSQYRAIQAALKHAQESGT